MEKLKMTYNNKIAPFFWGACEYVGVLIPNIVTTLWLSYSDYSAQLAWLFLITILGFIAQTLTFVHSKNIFKKISDHTLLILATILLALFVIMQYISIHLFLVVYLIFFALLTVVMASCFVLAKKYNK
ncbi:MULTISPECIES: hypothetical protein [Lactiplantibacillus]|uniref:hypothetical protein n=1 Tax=Lactiplantibacillus TaxID=2767842 RepID=UPI0022377DD4|nr:hypothetical protein [Lactiplantibacillus plantarum]MCW6146168.1 hypothetical protein [Lactiplantibacillus plantarum]WIR73761.1 hypothetical protein QP382_06025 [Lactiplantibacillus plantarum]